jgi:predicted DNA-binding transcriptional regulator AlpA
VLPILALIFSRDDKFLNRFVPVFLGQRNSAKFYVLEFPESNGFFEMIFEIIHNLWIFPVDIFTNWGYSLLRQNNQCPTNHEIRFCLRLVVLAKIPLFTRADFTTLQRNESSMPNQLADSLPETTRKKGENGIPKGYIGIPEMRTLFGRSRTTIFQMIAKGKLPKSLRYGKQRIWDRKTVLAWLNNAKFTK